MIFSIKKTLTTTALSFGLAVVVFCGSSVFAQKSKKPTKSETLAKEKPSTTKAQIEKILQENDSQQHPEIILSFARSFLNKPYKAHTLEANEKEQLVINLSGLDCYTLVETVMALTLTKESSNVSYDNFKKILQSIRYRNGKIDGYASRLHYYSDWLFENQKNGSLDILSKKIGGELYEKEIFFMSENAHLYKALRRDSAQIEQITLVENAINNRQYFYIQKINIKKIESKIQDGDIIAITTSKDGLDVSHEGFAIWQDGKLYLLHASSEQKKVIVSKEPLLDYLNKHKDQTGIMVARIK
jgi:hypothetical protein